MTFAIRLNLAGLDAALDAQHEKVQKAIRPAAQAGAQVLYDAVLANVRAIGRKTGNLASAIYQVYSAESIEGQKATYHVSWNHRKAPHGRLVEYGHIQKYAAYVGKDGKWYTAKKNGKPVPLASGPRQVAPKSFVRPAAAQLPVAEQAMRERFLLEVNQ